MTTSNNNDEVLHAISDLREQLNKFQDETNKRFDHIEGDIGVLKGNEAIMSTIQYAADIAADMGLEFVRTLGRSDLRKLSADASYLEERVLQSFRRADLVIEASDGGEPCYIAVEASYTADWHDVDRAARNARLLARFTGRSGHAVVASVHQHGSAEAGLESGKAHWYALFEPDLRPE